MMNTEASPIKSDRNGWIYTILLLFLGWTGAHRFYLGRIGMGIVYLFTTGFLGVGVVVDAIVLLAGGVRDANCRELEIEKSAKVFVVLLVLAVICMLAVAGVVCGVLFAEWWADGGQRRQ